MSPDLFLRRWIGPALAGIGVVGILWLAATDRLGLYIHPRYNVFTVVLALIALVFLVGGSAVLPLLRRRDSAADAAITPGERHGDHHSRLAENAGSPGQGLQHRNLLHDGHGGHSHSGQLHDDHDEDDLLAASRPRPLRVLWFAGAALIVAASAVALLVLPPAVLSVDTAQNRELNSATLSASASEVDLAGGDTSGFTVKDWSTLIRQGVGEDYFAGRTAELTGFVLPVDGTPDAYYVARFVITCCAVDAQPVAVAVYDPGWQDRIEPDDWVSVTGGFRSSPDPGIRESIVLSPNATEIVEQPAQPYVY